MKPSKKRRPRNDPNNSGLVHRAGRGEVNLGTPEQIKAISPKPQIYFAIDLQSRLIKIGCVRGNLLGNCPATRARELGARLRKPIQLLGCLEVNEGEAASDLEAKLHRQFKASRQQGEWFRLTDDLARLIRESSRGHICERCAGDSPEAAQRKAADAAQSVNRALRSKYLPDTQGTLFGGR